MNVDDLIIKIKDLTKIYRIYDRPLDRLKESIHPLKKSYHQDFYALKNISFELKRGETVGIVGKNGSGKSTLLKLITGVLTPTSGDISVNGKVSALLELGAGFNPEMTGIENIYLNGTIMGYSKEEMDTKLDSILSFADIGDFVNQPVKMYSSGMFARLAFAVSINVEPDILIVDEALSVGDVKFQLKCIEKMKEIQSNGTTVLFVSHATEQIKRFCTKAIWIDSGEIKCIGEANDVVNLYEDSLYLEEYENKQEEIKDLGNTPAAEEDKVGFITGVEIKEKIIRTFGDLEIKVNYKIFAAEVSNFLLGVAIYDRDRKYIFGPNTFLDNVDVPNTYGDHTVVYKIPNIPLLSGTYFIDVGIFTDKGLVCIHYRTNIESITVTSDYFTEGLVHLKHDWRVVK